jgi:hypothetical protein
LEEVEPTVAVLIDRGYKKVNRVLFLLHKLNDLNLLEYAPNPDLERNAFVIQTDEADFIKSQLPLKNIHLLSSKTNNDSIDKTTIKRHDLLIVSNAFWSNIKPERHKWLEFCPAILVVRVG